MSAPDIIRPFPGHPLFAWALGRFDLFARIGRAVWPIPRFKGFAAALRYDDVREVFERDDVFEVVYRERLDRIMGGEPFFLGMRDGPDYRRDTAAIRQAMPPDVALRLAPATEAAAAAQVAAAGGRIEVVDMVRRVTFDVLGDYFGVPSPPDADLALWATRLFEYQFASADPPLVAEVDTIAPRLRAHIDGLIAVRKSAGRTGEDVLGRALALQANGVPGTSDTQIRSALIGFIVGGFPQPPMVAPQALNELLKRPVALEAAQAAARDGNNTWLGALVFEAMRFDPLAPGVERRATQDVVIAAGTRRQARLREGTRVLACFRSAMRDGRRVPDPERFDPTRGPHTYIHFGDGLHRCFGEAINRALLPLMLKPLLARPGLRRVGRLEKRGAFAHRLVVEYG